MKKNKGITLVALLVTIIVMLILAGITITFVLGENGIIQYAKNAKEDTIKAGIKEEIELAITDIQMDEISRGKELTLEKLAGTEQLLANKLSGILAELKNNQIEGEYKEYSYTIDNNFKVTIIGKVTGMKVDYTLTPEGYTNQNVIITINAQPLDKIPVLSIVSENNLQVVEPNKSFKIIENGTYKFTITDANQNKKTISVPVDKIDKDAPYAKIELEVGTVFINGKAVANIEIDDAKSGIGTSKWIMNTSNTPLGTNESQYAGGGNLTNGTTRVESNSLTAAGSYYIHVLALDKLGNAKEYISDAITVKLGYLISTPQDLQNMKNNLSAEYFVTKDIDMTGFNFAMISGKFTGKLDGQGHTISNLNNGIFENIYNAEIKNILFKNVNVSTHVFSRYVEGNIVFNKVGVEGKIYSPEVGAMAGSFFVKTQGASSIDIINCYARTNISAYEYDVYGIGGVWIDHLIEANVINSYWSGTSSAKKRTGTLITVNSTDNNDNQYVSSRIKVQNSYYNKDLFTLPVPESMSGKGITTQEFRNIQNNPNWDFTNTWYINEQGYPELKF